MGLHALTGDAEASGRNNGRTDEAEEEEGAHHHVPSLSILVTDNLLNFSHQLSQWHR